MTKPKSKKDESADAQPQASDGVVQGAPGVPSNAGGPKPEPANPAPDGLPNLEGDSVGQAQVVGSTEVQALVPSDPNRPRRAGRKAKAEVERERLEREARERAELEAQQKLAREAALTRARAASEFLVKLIDKIASRYLPPPLTKEEMAELAEAGAPVVALYDADFMGSPWFGLGITAAAIYLPRWNEREQRKVGLPSYAFPLPQAAPQTPGVVRAP